MVLWSLHGLFLVLISPVTASCSDSILFYFILVEGSVIWKIRGMRRCLAGCQGEMLGGMGVPSCGISP